MSSSGDLSRRRPWRRVLATVMLLTLAGCANRTAPVASSPLQQPRASSTDAQAVAEAFERLRADPLQLQLFLREMPKGGDLHSHLTGAIYAESFVRWAVEDGLCLVRETLALARPPCEASEGRVPAASIVADAKLYDAVIDAWSMRNWQASRTSGHAQFFDSFAKFSLASRARFGDMLAEISARAAAQHVSYLELMHTVDDGAARRIVSQVMWTGNMGRMRDNLLAAGLRDALQQARTALDAAEARQRELLRCGHPDADAGCAVTIRYQLPALRASAPGDVFAQFLAGFELARLDPRVVGVNLVQPEDAPVPVRDFPLHMRMLDFLRASYPEVGVSLHAGELADGLVPPEALRFHIRASIVQGHARRIGHGVAVMHEDDPLGLLREMAQRQVLVEVALSSNDAILGVRGTRHPLATYLRHGVPVALVTDDEGVSRSSLTGEYQRAAQDQGLDYPTLRTIARNSLSYAFVEASEKARLLREFDTAIAQFERRWAARQRGGEGSGTVQSRTTLGRSRHRSTVRLTP